MTRVLGLDVGASYTKAVVMDVERRVVARSLVKTGFQLAAAAEKAYREVLATGGLQPEQIDYVASTGYGRYLVPMRDIQITELTCHGRGAAYLFPATRTVLDAGGQTVKAIKIDERGKVRAFRLNDKCAAGTGAFLDKTARYMGFEADSIGSLAMRSEDPVTISSICAVFAESEVINHLTAGAKPEDIMYGAVLSLAGRAIQLMKRVGMDQRRRKQVPCERVRGQALWIDGFNLLTTLEVALGGGVVLAARDGCYRDIASVHGTYRKVEETRHAIELAGRSIAEFLPAHCVWYLDSPVGNSGRLRGLLLETAREFRWDWAVEIVQNPDPVLIASEAIVATADSVILDRCARWVNLARHVISSDIRDAHVVPMGEQDDAG